MRHKLSHHYDFVDYHFGTFISKDHLHQFVKQSMQKLCKIIFLQNVIKNALKTEK